MVEGSYQESSPRLGEQGKREFETAGFCSWVDKDELTFFHVSLKMLLKNQCYQIQELKKCIKKCKLGNGFMDNVLRLLSQEKENLIGE